MPRIFKFFLVVFTARILGADDYGKFSFALAFAIFFLMFTDLGLPSIVTREFSKDRAQERHFPAIFALKIALALLTLLVTIAGSFLITQDPSVRLAIWILSFYVLSQSIRAVIYSYFHARQRMEYETLTRLFENLVLFCVGFFILFVVPSIQGISLTYAIAGLVGFISALILMHWRIAPIAFSFAPKTWKYFISLSWPLGLAGLGGTVIAQIDSLALGFFGQITQNGWYNAAYAIFGMTFLPGVIVLAGLFPVMNKAFNMSLEKFQKIYNLQMELMIFFAFGFFAGGLALASQVIDFFYDPSYAPAILALQILILANVFVFLSEPLNQALIVVNMQKKVFVAVFAGAAVNVLLDIVLIPQWSLYGTAFATFAAYVTITAFLLRGAILHLPITILGTSLRFALLGGAVAAAATYVFLNYLGVKDLHVLFLVAAGGVVYLSTFLAFRFLASKVFPNAYRYATKDV